jgi:phosphatidate cytidylyltransferase
MTTGLSNNLILVLLGIITLLVVATLVVVVLKRSRPESDYTELELRVRTWWAIVAIFSFAILVNRVVAIVFLAFVSFLALKEYLSMIPTRRSDRRVLFWAYLSIPIQYYWVYKGWYGMFIIFIPVFIFLLLPMRMALIGETKGFLRAAGTLHWGLMITVFGLSHAAYLLALPTNASQPAGGEGLLLYLVFLTQFNDIAQYIWGKLFGRHKVTPLVSPNKTYEGLLGGVFTTLLLAFLLAPVLTPLSNKEVVIAGVIISFGGFIGDVNISAIKRDLGVKDSSSVLPGHGGVLDRVDSLSYTAPLFFHFIYYMHF